jgi:hypothetical protein
VLSPDTVCAAAAAAALAEQVLLLLLPDCVQPGAVLLDSRPTLRRGTLLGHVM